MSQRKPKYPPVLKKVTLRRDTSDSDDSEMATNGSNNSNASYISDSEVRSRSAKKGPRDAVATSNLSDSKIYESSSESSSDNSAEPFSSSLGKVKAIEKHLKATLKMVAELEQDL